MADPLGIIEGIANIFQINSEVIDLIRKVNDVSGDRQKIILEIIATTGLCKALIEFAELDADAWAKTFKTLRESNKGPVQLFRRALSTLGETLHPDRRAFPTAYPMLASQR